MGVCVWHVATANLMAQIVRESDHMMKEGQGATKSCYGGYHNMTTLAISLYDVNYTTRQLLLQLRISERTNSDSDTLHVMLLRY